MVSLKLGKLKLNTVHKLDVIEGLQLIPDESIDLVVTDPPYLINYRSNRRIQQEKFDYIKNDKGGYELIKEFFKIIHAKMKNNTAIYIFCSWHHVDFFKQEFEKYFKLKNIIVWNKNNHGSGDLKASYAPKHEFILYGHKGRSLFRNKRLADVIDCAKVPSSKLTHPTEKPIQLLDIFILNNSDEGDIVLDGFAGTGSTGISAIKNKRRFIGFEIVEEYADIANKRIKKYLNKASKINTTY